MPGLAAPPNAGIDTEEDGALTATLPDSLFGDERRLKQVLINLVKNATKFTREGTIKIKSWYRTDIDSLVIHVEDTGVGIAAEDKDKLFSWFGKLQRTAEMNHEGIGLGLTVVKSIVEKSGGDVAVHSEGIGKGACFCVAIPMETNHSADYFGNFRP